MFARRRWRQGSTLLLLAATSACANPPTAQHPPTAAASLAQPSSAIRGPAAVHRDLAYGPVEPGNLLDLYVPDVAGDGLLPLIIWNSGSGWSSDAVKDWGEEVPVVAKFTARGYAVASISIRSSLDVRFPGQAYDVRAAIRYLREVAATYRLDPERFAFMGDSSGGWAAAFAAMTSDDVELVGETGVDGTSSAIRVAVAFYAPTDLLSMDGFAQANHLPMAADAYPHDGPLSREGYFIQCPGEGPTEGYPIAADLVSIQECPEAAELADPSSYVSGAEVPIWLLHGLADATVPYNQSRLLYDATAAEGNEARLSLAPGRDHHSPANILNAWDTTTWTTDSNGHTTSTVGSGPTWHDIEQFLRAHLG